MKSLFFLGKGGVGKSTCSALTALGLAREGFQTLLISLDPAHNLGDLLERKVGERPVKVIPGLEVSEVSREKWLRRFLDGVEKEIRASYRYLTAFNLDHYFKLFRQAPGLEEHALLSAYEEIRQGNSKLDYLIVDMPPTALSLKFFAEPSLSLLWLENLRKLRQEILEKRELITSIRFGKKEIGGDGVLGRIEENIARSKLNREHFKDPEQSRFLLVINPDKLSIAEGKRIIEELMTLEISPQLVLLNRHEGENAPPGAFEGRPVAILPRIDPPPMGLTSLESTLADFPLSQVRGGVVH